MKNSIAMDVKVRRLLMSFVGVMICGVGVGIMKTAALGVDPFQSLMAGLDILIPISFGTLYVIVNLAMMSFSLVFSRKLIGIATFINMFFLGYVAEFTQNILMGLFPEPSMALRSVILFVGILTAGCGCSFYITTDLGVSTYDAISITMADRWHLGQFRYCRIATDCVCMILGAAAFLAAGGKAAQLPTLIGVGTVITAFCLGPLIELVSEKIAKPLLAQK